MPLEPTNPNQWPPLRRTPAWKRALNRARRAASTPVRYIVLGAVLVALYFAFGYARHPTAGTSSVLTPTIAELTVPRNPLYDRPARAPNGSPWPAASGYVAGYPRLAVGGDADVVVDNSEGRNDLFVKLVRLDSPQPTAVRIVLVRAGQTFPLKRVGPARYDMRYLNLDTGSIHRTDEFAVIAKKRPEGGVDYTGWTVPLYTTLEGSVYHDEITAAEF
jgi:hypothetical protein